MSDDARPRTRSLTTRRGFVALMSLGGVSLYGLWAAYGAAPFRLFEGGGHGDGHGAPEPEAAGHGGHGAAQGPSPDDFRRATADFVARHRQADGSVLVEPPKAASASDHGGHGAHGAHGAHGGHAAPVVALAEPMDVYVMAERWAFEPSVLRLRAGQPYRFRFMAVDGDHGASIQLGRGSRIVRLRRGVEARQDLTFTAPGTYLVYCTVYCGVAHDRMSGTIVVA